MAFRGPLQPQPFCGSVTPMTFLSSTMMGGKGNTVKKVYPDRKARAAYTSSELRPAREECGSVDLLNFIIHVHFGPWQHPQCLCWRIFKAHSMFLSHEDFCYNS